MFRLEPFQAYHNLTRHAGSRPAPAFRTKHAGNRLRRPGGEGCEAFSYLDLDIDLDVSAGKNNFKKVEIMLRL
jgi:hypothetical protein